MTGIAITYSSEPNDALEFVIRFLPYAAVAVAIGGSGAGVAEMSKQHHREKLARLANGRALYFRPFDFDLTTTAHETKLPQGMFTTSSIPVSLEEILDATCLSLLVKLECIGDQAFAIGPDTKPSDDLKWRELAIGLMESAQIIIVVPGSSPGSFWELRELKERELLDKATWIMPPVRMSSAPFELIEGWMDCSDRCRQELGLPFPNIVEHGAIFCYSAKDLSITIRPFTFKLLWQCVALAAEDGTQSGHIEH